MSKVELDLQEYESLAKIVRKVNQLREKYPVSPYYFDNSTKDLHSHLTSDDLRNIVKTVLDIDLDYRSIKDLQDTLASEEVTQLLRHNGELYERLRKAEKELTEKQVKGTGVITFSDDKTSTKSSKFGLVEYILFLIAWIVGLIVGSL